MLYVKYIRHTDTNNAIYIFAIIAIKINVYYRIII
uniref:Uncharacterized protein n=1 Tax=Anguilla anguilla TaxID=7936 RepID=A0A0E9RXB5_ANGAN